MVNRMSKTVLYIATTIDGKIARKDGSLDWLFALPNPNNVDYGYADFIRSIGTTIMGKNTYNEILGFGVEWPYRGMSSYVATTEKGFAPPTPDTYAVTSDLTEFVHNLKHTTEKDIWLIGGGKLVTYFLHHELLDRMILTIIPTIIGAGIALFPDDPSDTSWDLTDVQKFETGVVSLTYDRR